MYPNNAEFVHLMLLFGTKGQRNVTKVIRQVHNDCFTEYNFCFEEVLVDVE